MAFAQQSCIDSEGSLRNIQRFKNYCFDISEIMFLHNMFANKAFAQQSFSTVCAYTPKLCTRQLLHCFSTNWVYDGLCNQAVALFSENNFCATEPLYA